MCDGAIGLGDPEFEEHRQYCRICKYDDGFLSADNTAYRPHTFTNDCWCTEHCCFTDKRCRLARQEYGTAENASTDFAWDHLLGP